MDKQQKSAYSFCQFSTSPGEDLQETMDFVVPQAVEVAVGQKLSNRYVLRSELGEGGMGKVFLAYDIVLQRNVALKVTLDARSSVSLGSANAFAEGQKAALVNHPMIASVYDTGVHEGRPFTIFEFVDGIDLRKAMGDRPNGWPVEDVAPLLWSLAEALDFAHSRGVVHRDLKPENIALAPSGVPKILDFGLATRLNAAAAPDCFVGTAAYAAPEQARCQLVDGRSDQYALGLVVYELLCARRPFDEPYAQGMLYAHAHFSPPSIAKFREDLTAEVVTAVMRTLSKNPEDRFATCREFAAAFQAGLRSTRVGSAFEQRTDIHITATQSDSLVAKLLAGSLESKGYRAWYYQRDALPGIPLRRQARDSMRASNIALLLISRNSLSSQAFEYEVMDASELGRPFLPILVDMSLDEFSARPPTWRPTLGASAIIEYQRSNLDNILNRLCQSLELLGVQPTAPQKKVLETKKSSSAQAWVTDSNQIDTRDLQRIVFRNQVIDDYLTRPNKYFLSATKGLGKTLLMKYKRRLLTQDISSKGSVCLIPSGQPYLDFMSEMSLISKNYDTQFTDLSFCKRMWGIALRISILSHHPELLPVDQQFEIAEFPSRIQRWMRGAAIEPTVVLKELTNLPVSEVNRLIVCTENFLDELVRRVHASTFIFIDKVDQAVRRLSREAWIHIQAGLIEAAWDLMSANTHIKIFASIRQEAFANYRSDIKANLLGATTMLRYTDDELQSLMDQLSSCYEGADGFRAFVGINVIKHPRRPFPEDSFQYLKRFTFGRPRDFVAIAAELSASQNSLDEQRYCELIKHTSGLSLVPSLFDENKVFLDCLHDRENQARFFALLRTNIMTRAQAVAINREFNGLPADSSLAFDEESPDIFHPFRDLFLAGLLGFAKRDDQDLQFQRFRQPDDSLSTFSRELPNSSHYFIHPALSEYIQRSRASENFRVIQQILVGEYAPWHSFDPMIFEVELALANRGEQDIRDLVHELLSYIKIAKLSSGLHSVRTEIDSIQKWQNLTRELTARNHDDLALWLEELIDS